MSKCSILVLHINYVFMRVVGLSVSSLGRLSGMGAQRELNAPDQPPLIAKCRNRLHGVVREMSFQRSSTAVTTDVHRPRTFVSLHHYLPALVHCEVPAVHSFIRQSTRFL